jgi:ankyrin repeat protein
MKRKRKPHRPLSFSALEAGDMSMLRMRIAEYPDLAHDRDLNGMTLLRTALASGNRDVVDLLLETAGPLDAFEAASLGKGDRLSELLDAGEASPDDVAPEGFGLLHLACFYGHGEVAALLLDRGANLEAVSKHPMGVRPVHCAAAARRADLVEALLDRGADVNAKQGGGWTLLHHAAQRGDAGLAAKLLERGADASIANDRGQTPAEVARGGGHEELAARLG